jgi:hypothetical protein
VHGAHPLLAEIEVFVDVLLIVVAVIQVADVKRRIGEAQIDPRFGAFIEDLDRIALDDLIGFRGDCTDSGGSRKSCASFSHLFHFSASSAPARTQVSADSFRESKGSCP